MNNNKLSIAINQKLIMAIGVVSILSLLSVYFTEFPKNIIRNLDGTLANNAGIKSGIYTMILFNVPLLGLILGSLCSFIPYKKLSYKNKWFRFVLVSMLGFSLLTFISAGVSLIRYVFGI